MRSRHTAADTLARCDEPVRHQRGPDGGKIVVRFTIAQIGPRLAVVWIRSAKVQEVVFDEVRFPPAIWGQLIVGQSILS